MSVVYSKEAVQEIQVKAAKERAALRAELRKAYGDQAEAVRKRFVANAVAAWSE